MKLKGDTEKGLNMNTNHLSQIFKKYIEKFEYVNSKEHKEYYKWQVCYRFKPLMDAALNADSSEFADALYKVQVCTKNIIDSYTQPFYGLVKMAYKDPKAVRQMFKDLYSDDADDLKKQMELIEKFLIRSNELLEVYYPGSHLYKQNSHSVSSYLFLYDPDHHYMYKATQSQAMADCVEFYDDWGSGDNIKLDVYYRMCDEILAEIKSNSELLATNNSRYDGRLRHESGELHPDPELHILLYDIIYCCHVYDLFDGISFKRLKSKEKQLIIEQKNKAQTLKADYDAAARKVEELEEAGRCFTNMVTESGKVIHKKFGVCDVISVDPEYINLKIESTGEEKKLNLFMVIANGILKIDSPEFDIKRTKYRDVLKKAKDIPKSLKYASHALAPYEEYLD